MSARPERYATFHLDNQIIAVPVQRVDEVLGAAHLTPVPMAAPGIAGLLNLRGEIVLAQDVRVSLLRPRREPDEPTVHVVVRASDERLSFVFDRAGDVVDVSPDEVEAPPPTLPDVIKSVTTGVVPRKGHVLMLIDIDQLARLE